MPRIASLSPHELRGCTLRVTLTALLRLRLESRQIRADSGRSYEGCRKSEKLRDEGPLSNQRLFLLVRRACSTAWRCKSSSQPDRGEVIAKRKGLTMSCSLTVAYAHKLDQKSTHRNSSQSVVPDGHLCLKQNESRTN